MKKIFVFYVFISAFSFAQDRPCGFKNGLQEGTCKFFYENGTPKEISNWDKGKLDGKAQFFYENGKVKSEGEYKKGFQNKMWTFYKENGSKDSEENHAYKDGLSKLDGLITNYYPTGKIETKGNYKNGKQDGKWQSFYENGKPKIQSTFINGNREGERKLYKEDGTLDKIENYKKGVLQK